MTSPLERIETTGEHVFAEWRCLKCQGRVAVIVGDDERFQRLTEGIVLDGHNQRSPAEIAVKLGRLLGGQGNGLCLDAAPNLADQIELFRRGHLAIVDSGHV